MKKYLSILLGLLWLLTLSLGGVQAQDQTIVEIAASNDDFSTLVTAVEAAGLLAVSAE